MAKNNNIQTHDAEIKVVNGITPFNSEVTMARQVVVVQEPVLHLKLKMSEAHRIIYGYQNSRPGQEGTDYEYFTMLMTLIEDFMRSDPPREAMEPKTIFDE